MAGNANPDRPDVLLPTEVEAYVDALKFSNFEELGSLGWIEKHDRIEKLTLQAIIEALSEKEEAVKEMLVSREKITTFVHDLILTELWREEIYPELMKHSPKSTFGIYTILYHEATCINLIETILYHPNAAETLGDAALDLIDYCFRSLNLMLARKPVERMQSEKKTLEMDLPNQSEMLLFRVSFKALTCLRYLIENINKIESSVVPRLVITSDTPMLLTEILLQKPWLGKSKDGKELEYDVDEQSWTESRYHSSRLIGKVEGQAWLAIYQLFKHERIISTYQISNYRKNQLLKLRSMLHEVALEQIPVLGEFHRWLNELAMCSGPSGPSKTPLILEMMPPFRPLLETQLRENKTKILEIQMNELVNPSHEVMQAKAQKLASTYDFDAFAAVLPPAKCASCGEKAFKKCGRCHSEWYCTRECQVKHWPKHKIACNLSCPSETESSKSN